MNFLDRFAKRPPAEPASLQMLFGAVPVLDHLTAMLRAYHPDLTDVSVELANVTNLPGAETVLSPEGPRASVLGLIGWGKHVIKLAAFAEPMPRYAIEGCIQAALLPDEIKADARNHSAHVLLYYSGEDERPLEQLVALSVVAGVLAECGAIVTLNEEARAAVLSTDLLPDLPGEDMLEVLRNLPLPYLYCGFVKMLLTDVPGVWMRTFAAPRLGLPNLAYHAPDHEEGQATFRLFAGLLAYLHSTGLTFEAGEAIRVDENRVMSLRAPHESEWWLDSPGTLWVLADAREP